MDSKRSSRHLEKKSITEQAAEWLIVLEERGEDANPAFADWLRESPTHVQAYLRAATLDTALKRVDPERSIDIVRPEPGAWTPDISPQLSGNFLQVRPAANSKRALWRAAAGLAALGVILAVAWTAFDVTNPQSTTYQTDVGEQRAVDLRDGSTLTLNTNSRVEVSFTGTERRLRLLAGEAIFRVQRDSARPFRVYSDDTVVQAIGTTFHIYRKADQTIVSVLEGRVSVMPAKKDTQSVYLNAGEEVRVNSRNGSGTKQPANVANLTAWRERRLVFVDESLESIGEELNRYNRSPKIRVEGEAARTLRYAAILEADDPESLVAVLSSDPRVTVTQSENEILIQPRGVSATP